MSDVSAAYPNGEDILNASRETTVAEVVKIKGVPEHVQRPTGINMTGGSNNAIETMCTVLKAPTFNDLSKSFERYLETGEMECKAPIEGHL